MFNHVFSDSDAPNRASIPIWSHVSERDAGTRRKLQVSGGPHRRHESLRILYARPFFFQAVHASESIISTIMVERPVVRDLLAIHAGYRMYSNDTDLDTYG
jgi:hypothetical protein